MNSNSIVRAAFDHAAQHSAEYLAKCLSTRLASSPERAGSWFDSGVATTPEALLAALLAAQWVEYSHPELKSPAVGFRAEIGGKLGMVALSDLPADAEIVLLDPKGGFAHWDQKQKVGASVSASAYGLEAPRVGHTTLILGPSSREPNAPLTVWTFHPGAPVAPSMVDRLAEDGTDRHGLTVTVAEAIALGFGLAKLT